MLIDERIVIEIPKSVHNRSRRQMTVWVKRLVSRAVMKARAEILERTNEDIFNVFLMTDCVEISIKGDLETLHVENGGKGGVKPWYDEKAERRRRYRRRK